jgi:RNA polymerase sigma-70 factor (ECF subfamily)
LCIQKESETVTDLRREIVPLLPRLQRFARSLARVPADAEDLFQAAVEKALRHEDQWQPGTKLESWLFRITQNLWFDELRAHRRRSVPLESVPEPMADEGRDTASEGVDVDRIQAAFHALPDTYRTVFSLVVIDGQSYKEAAATLGVPVGTIMSRLARARAQLAALVTEAPALRKAGNND